MYMYVCIVVYIVLIYSFLFDYVSQSFNKRHLTYLIRMPECQAQPNFNEFNSYNSL